jgi:hypothetical protein
MVPSSLCAALRAWDLRAVGDIAEDVAEDVVARLPHGMAVILGVHPTLTPALAVPHQAGPHRGHPTRMRRP